MISFCRNVGLQQKPKSVYSVSMEPSKPLETVKIAAFIIADYPSLGLSPP